MEPVTLPEEGRGWTTLTARWKTYRSSCRSPCRDRRFGPCCSKQLQRPKSLGLKREGEEGQHKGSKSILELDFVPKDQNAQRTEHNSNAQGKAYGNSNKTGHPSVGTRKSQERLDEKENPPWKIPLSKVEASEKSVTQLKRCQPLKRGELRF